MPVDMLAIPNATGAAIAPARAASSAPAAASFANALAASGNSQPADAAADPSPASDPVSSGPAPGSSSPAGRSPAGRSSGGRSSGVSGVGNDSNTDDQTAPGASSSSINPGSIFSGGTVSAGRLISKLAAKTLDSRTGVNSAKTNVQARTAPSSSQSSPPAMSLWLTQQVAAAPQLALTLASLGTNIVPPTPPPIAAPAAIGAAAPSIFSTGAANEAGAIQSAATTGSESMGPIATDLTQRTISTVSPGRERSAAAIGAVASFSPLTPATPELESASSATTTAAGTGVTATFLTPPASEAAVPRQATSPLQTIPLQIARQAQNISSMGITSPSTSSAILSTVLPVSLVQVSTPPASPNSGAPKIFARETEAKSSLALNLPVTDNSAGGSQQAVTVATDAGASRLLLSGGPSSTDLAAAPPPVDSGAAATIIGEAATVANPGAANITGLPESGLPDGTPRTQTGSTSPASAQPIPASVAATIAVASVPAGILTSVSPEPSPVAPTTNGPAASKPTPFASLIAALQAGESLDAGKQVSPIIPRSFVPAKPGLVASSRADEMGRTIPARDSDKSSSIVAKPASSDPAAPGPSDASANESSAEPLGASVESSGGATSTSVSDAQGPSTGASSSLASANDSKVSASPATGAAGPSTAVPPSVSLPDGPKSSAAAAAPVASLQSSPASTAGSAPAHDAGSNTPLVVPSSAPSAAAPATSEKSGAPSDLPPAHQMLDSGPVPSPSDPALASTGARLPSDPAALQMRLEVHTNAFGNVEIHTVVEQSQVGVAIHGDRDIARWFNSEIGGLEIGLQGHHLNLTGVDFSSNRSGVQTATSFQQGQPRQNSSQNQNPGSYASARPDGAAQAEPVNESDLGAALPVQGMETRVSILA
ncbi:MAG: hypothetical protein WA213_14990 [Terriglobales bacterium]